jgi:uncharacterized damage-inducible protein DinB
MPDEPALPPARDLLLGDLDAELATTRRVIERVPDAELGWRPHERSWTLGELATHVVNLLEWTRMMLDDDSFDLAANPAPRETLPDRESMLREWDERAERVRARVSALEEQRLMQPWTLMHGAHTVLKQPRAVLLRAMCVNHLIHHRGQLSVYLRLLDVPVPSIYGPSADEAGGG